MIHVASIGKRKHKDGTIVWHARVRRHGFPPESRTFASYKRAKAWADVIEADLRECREPPRFIATQRTVGAMLRKFIDARLTPTRHCPLTAYQRQKKAQLLWWRHQLGDVLLAQCQPGTISTAMDVLANRRRRGGKPRRAAATVNRYAAALGHVFNVAVQEWGWLERNPMQKITLPKEPPHRDRRLSEDEVTALLHECARCTTKPLLLLVQLALMTGARKQELLRLHAADIHLPEGVIILHHTKNKRKRRIYVSGWLAARLQAHLEQLPAPRGLVFPSRRRRAVPMDIDREFRAARHRAGIKDFRFHDLRHSFASWMAENGATLLELMQALGHSEPKMVMRYSHLTHDHSQEHFRRVQEQPREPQL